MRWLGTARLATILALAMQYAPPSLAVTFGEAAVLNPDAAVDHPATDSAVYLATRAGTWLAVWESNYWPGVTTGTGYNIRSARSTDAGVTWIGGDLLNSNASGETPHDWRPSVAGDGLGVWVAVWDTNDPVGGLYGTDTDVLMARSLDDGVTWQATTHLNERAMVDNFGDQFPSIATDATGKWVAIWSSRDTISGSLSSAFRLFAARSTDQGLNWTSPKLVNATGASDPATGSDPNLVTDEAGTWLVVFSSYHSLGGTIGTDNDILSSRSTNDGVTWSAPIPVDTNAATDSELDLDIYPSLATDSAGKWMAVWFARNTFSDPGENDDGKILAAVSGDGGLSWADPSVIHDSLNRDWDFNYRHPDVAFADGKWVVVWSSSDSETALTPKSTSESILVSESADHGASWSTPRIVTPLTGSGFHVDHTPSIAVDAAGNWTTAWHSSDPLGPGAGTIGGDFDILYARSGTDTDNDNLLDDSETGIYGTNPNLWDTDGDGLPDGVEISFNSDPLVDDDSDGDGLLNSDEILVYGTSATLSDTDDDYLDDYEELFVYGTDPFDPDIDNDGAEDGVEILFAGTDPFDPDTDDDDLLDGDELYVYYTDPLNPDTDYDGLSDGDEVLVFGTNPNLRDSDYDGFGDWHEIRAGSDPLDPESTPPDTVPALGSAPALLCATAIAIVGWGVAHRGHRRRPRFAAT